MVDTTAGKMGKDVNSDPSYISKSLLMACLTTEANYTTYQEASGGAERMLTQIPGLSDAIKNIECMHTKPKDIFKNQIGSLTPIVQVRLI